VRNALAAIAHGVNPFVGSVMHSLTS